jgi:hypothetical protein
VGGVGARLRQQACWAFAGVAERDSQIAIMIYMTLDDDEI